MKVDSLYDSNVRRVYSSGRVILPKFHFEYFKNKTFNPIYSKFKDFDYNIICIADHKDIEEKFHDGDALITESRNLFIPKDALTYLHNPERVMLLGIFDRLEVWNLEEFKEYDLFHPDSLEELAKDLGPEVNRIPF